MKILVENSTWNNIGDGFYQSTLFALFKQLYPDQEVYMGEGPFKRAFRPRSKKHLAKAYLLMDDQHADVHIFSGPIVKKLIENYGEKIKQIVARGDRYALISVSSAHISDQATLATGAFLEQYPPLLMATRDEETFNRFKPFNINLYNGICTAFLVNRMLPVLEYTPQQPFFISSFYNELEPLYQVEGNVTLENIKLQRKASLFGLKHRYSRHLNAWRPQQRYLGNHRIIRVHQDLSTHFYHVKFSHPNSFMSFNPLSYLSIYKSADFTISDRVHSCAVSVAFNKPAKLLTNSPRAGIFDRLGYQRDREGIIRPIDPAVIDKEIERLSDAIKHAI